MIIKMRGHTYQTKKAIPQWIKIANEYNSGIPVPEIAKKYTNPHTGKQYTEAYVYWVLKRVQTL